MNAKRHDEGAWVSFPIAYRPGGRSKPVAQRVLIMPVDRSEVSQRVFTGSAAQVTTLGLPAGATIPGVVGRRRYRDGELGLRLQNGQVLLPGLAYRLPDSGPDARLTIGPTIRATIRPAKPVRPTSKATRPIDEPGIRRLPGARRPGPPARAAPDLIQVVVDTCNAIGTEMLTSAVTAGAAAVWQRRKRRPLPQLDAERAEAVARFHIAVQFPPVAGPSLTNPTVLRDEANAGWVVRLTDQAGRRRFEARYSDATGAWNIGFENLPPRHHRPVNWSPRRVRP